MVSNVKRIVSLAPSNTEILFFLGLGSRIVGVSEQCDYPPEAAFIEKAGSFVAPDIEKIISIKPDLVCGYGQIHGRFLERLESRGIHTVSLYPDSVETILKDMERIAVLCGREDGLNRVAELRSRFGALQQKLKEVERPGVLRLMGEGYESIRVPTNVAFQYDVIRIAGGEPMPVHGGDAYQTVSIAEVRSFNPDIILCCGKTKREKPRPRCKGCTLKHPVCQRDVEDVMDWEIWGDIPAVRKKRFYPLPCGLSCRPGPRIVESIKAVAKLLHPEISLTV
jgi:iron complex transport system substrate-binding protein